MKKSISYLSTLLIVLLLFVASCTRDSEAVDLVVPLPDSNAENDSIPRDGIDPMLGLDFKFRTTIQMGGEGAAEISAFDPLTNRLFTVNVARDQISIYDISNLDTPKLLPPISVAQYGAPNSVAVSNGKLAIAVEALDKQANGYIKLYDTATLNFIEAYTVGALPDMVAFSPDGKYLVSANEGEPNNDYTIDPKGTISIINIAENNIVTLGFEDFEDSLSALQANGFRVFGPNASLAMDTEPEYVAISDDSQTAWVTLQENNGVAKVNLPTMIVEAIYPLGFKDYSLAGNAIDPSDKDDKIQLGNYPVFGMYMPDAIAYANINGADYIITANEGDAREYEGTPGFLEEDRVGDILLDTLVFPNFAVLQRPEILGRLKITKTLGDPDGDGYYNELYSYGARSFTIWSGNGQMVYDSGSDIAQQTSDLTPAIFNGGDERSDDKGAEPETVEVLRVGEKIILLVGLERNNQVMLYDITNPVNPTFIAILSNEGDLGPEGILAVPAVDSPTGKDLIVVSNEVSGGVTFYEN